jgi:hypothetical protein
MRFGKNLKSQKREILPEYFHGNVFSINQIEMNGTLLGIGGLQFVIMNILSSELYSMHLWVKTQNNFVYLVKNVDLLIKMNLD